MFEKEHIIHYEQLKNILLVARKSIEMKIIRETNQPIYAGRKWTIDEDEQLKKEYLSKLPINDIAKNHQRSMGSIKSRIVKLFPEMLDNLK